MAKFATTVGVVLGAALMCMPALGQVTISGSSTQVTTRTTSQIDPSVDGDLVVYTDLSNGDADVYFTDLTTGAETQVTSNPGSQQLQDVGGGIIVYSDQSMVTGASVIQTFDVATGLTAPVASATANDSRPTISGGVVAFQGFGTSYDIYAYDLSVGATFTVTSTTDQETNPRVDGTQIVYQRSTAAGWEVLHYDLSTGSEQRLASGLAHQPTPDISGNTVAYVGGTAADAEIAVHDLLAGTTSLVAVPGTQSRPRLAGEMLAYDDLAGTDMDVVLLHLPSGVESRITGAAGSSEFLNDIAVGRVAYTSDVSGNFDIWVYEYTVNQPQPPTGDLCDGSETPDESHSFSESSSATLTGQGSGQVVVRVEGDCDDAELSLDGQVLLDEDDLEGGDACWSIAVSLSGSSVVTVALDEDDDDHGDDGDDDHDGCVGHENDRGRGHTDHGNGHGYGHDKDRSDECSVSVEVHLDGAAATATAAAAPAVTMAPEPPATGCESGTGTAAGWLMLLVAGALLLTGRREPARVSIRRSNRR